MGFKKEGEKIENVTPIKASEIKETEEIKEEEIEEVIETGQNERDLSTKVDEKRQEFNAFNKKLRYINYGVLGLSLVIVVLAFALAMTLGNKEGNSWITILVFCVAIVCFIGIYIFTRIQRKQVEAKSNEYISFVFNETNKLVYSNPKFKDINITLKGDDSIKELFDKTRIFLNIKSFKAINVVKGKVNDIDFTAFDCAASILVKNRPQPRFLGRMFVFDLKDVDPSLRALFQVKGKEYSYPVDDIEEMSLVDGNDKYSFYLNKEEGKKILNNKVLSLIKKFKISKQIIDVIVSINDSKLFIGIDYSDEMINVPTDKSLNLENIKKQEIDVEHVISIIEEINK